MLKAMSSLVMILLFFISLLFAVPPFSGFFPLTMESYLFIYLIILLLTLVRHFLRCAIFELSDTISVTEFICF